MTNPDYGLGRREQFDPLSRNFPIRSVLDTEQIVIPRSYTWAHAPVLNQGSTGTCVGHAGAAELAARPVKWPISSYLAFVLYELCCKRDIWPENDNGNINFGTSVLALMQVMRELGFITEYRWAGAGSGRALEDLVLSLGYKGPAIMGTVWLNSMFSVAGDGHIVVNPNSGQAGGHAYLLYRILIKWLNNRKPANPTFADVDKAASQAWIVNSWGNWGILGEAFLNLNELEFLLQNQGESAIPIARTRTS